MGFSGCSPNATFPTRNKAPRVSPNLLLGETSSQAGRFRGGVATHKLGGLCVINGRGDFFLPYKSRFNGVISLLIGLIIPLNLLFGQL